MRIPVDDGYNEAVIDNGEDEDDAVYDGEQDANGECLFQQRRKADLDPRPVRPNVIGRVREEVSIATGNIRHHDSELVVQEWGDVRLGGCRHILVSYLR